MWNVAEKVFLIHNARAHPFAQTQQELQHLKWDIFGHPLYSPDLAPSDFHLFLKQKGFLVGKQFANNEALKEAMTSWLRSLVVEELTSPLKNWYRITISALTAMAITLKNRVRYIL